MTAQLRGRHDLGEIVGYAWRIYFANFSALFLLGMIVAPLIMLSAVVLREIDDDATAESVGLLFQIPELIAYLIATGALVVAVHEITGGSKPSVEGAIDAGLRRFPALISTQLLAGALVVASCFAFPFLGIWWLFKRDATVDGRREWWMLIPLVLPVYLSFRWTFVPQEVMLRDRRRWGALDGSAGAVRGQWWRTVGVLIVVGLITLGPTLLAAASYAAPAIVEAIVTSTVAAFVLPFAVAGQTLLWYDLNARAKPPHTEEMPEAASI